MHAHDPTRLNELLPLLAASARARAAAKQRFAHLWRMTIAEPTAAMWRRKLSPAESQAWSRRPPHEVPLIGGELAYIVMYTPEWNGNP